MAAAPFFNHLSIKHVHSHPNLQIKTDLFLRKNNLNFVLQKYIKISRPHMLPKSYY